MRADQSLRMAMEGYLPHSLCYLVWDRDDGVHVVDPGADSDANMRRLEGALLTVGADLSHVVSITATHMHPDHLGMADRLRAATGAPIGLHAREQLALDALQEPQRARLERELAEWNVPESERGELLDSQAHRVSWHVRADRLLADGDRLPVPGRHLVVVHTPGHTPGHICLRDLTNHSLFAGDLVLPNAHPGAGLGGASTSNPMSDLMQSLRRVSLFENRVVLPGHGDQFAGLRERCDQILRHHRNRRAEVDLVRRRLGPSVWDITKEIDWSAGWEGLRGTHRLSALRQVGMLLAMLEEPPAS